MTIKSTAPERVSESTISSACSPVSVADQQPLQVHAEFLGRRTECPAHVRRPQSAGAAQLLHFGNDL
jgi:hypothetical protein